jgi:1-acyl-sn-glycerol-3-phosphate acyltransferase
MADLPRPAIRRPISITVLSLTFFVLLLVTPIVLPVSALLDLITRTPMRRSRTWLLYLFILGNEGLGTWLSIAMVVFHAGRLHRPKTQARFHRLMVWWGGRHLTYLRWFAGLRWVIENPEVAKGANAIVLARHASHADAVLPILIFGNVGGYQIRYTLKEDLQWSPAMDIVGNLLPHVFVDRSPPPDSPLWPRIRELATGVDDDTVTIIFPEGTFYTPERLDRAATRIAETRPDLEAKVRSLGHLLPPRPAGTHALLDGAPGADLVLVAHAGMEAFGDLAQIRASLPLREPVRVRLWRIDRSDVPTDDGIFAGWLLDRWVEMDAWINAELGDRTNGEASASSSQVPSGMAEFRA